MVEKMYMINVAGPIKDIDSFVDQHVIPHHIQLINDTVILDSVKGLHPFTHENPYDSILKKIEKLCDHLNISLNDLSLENADISQTDVEPLIDDLNQRMSELDQEKKKIEKEIKRKSITMKQLHPILNLDIEMEQFFSFKFIKFRFGKMSKESFKRLHYYLENLEIILFKVFEEGEDVYIVYFMPHMEQENIDSLFATHYFERIKISDTVKGKPKEALARLENDIKDLEQQQKLMNEKIKSFYKDNFTDIAQCYNLIIRLDKVFDVRKYAVRSKESFYITGWIPESSLKPFLASIEKEECISCFVEEVDTMKNAKPPTKLNNKKFFKPFEALVYLYGTPSYNELDPTIFVAITYLLMFGMMFGDVGQGLLISFFGWRFYKKSRNSIAMIAVYLGLSSAVFGLFYGSFFGNETFLREVFYFIPMINPMEHKMLILGVAIAFGVLLLIIATLLNIRNKFNSKKYGKMLFDRHGITGLIFYISLLVGGAALAFNLDVQIQPWHILLLIVLPLIIMFLSHPLENLLARRKRIFPKKSGFFIEAFFEMIETLLGILSNTISFIRLGAFALNHVGFFIAFHALADMAGSGGSIIVMIIGNIIVIGLEGLIVSIQGLRLQYYELFSRYFSGDGIPFKPFEIKNRQMSH